MTRKNEVGFSALALAGTFLTTYSIKNAINDSLRVLPNWVYTIILIVGIFFFILSLAILLLPPRLLEMVMNIDILSDPDFDCRPAKRSELKFVYDFSKEEIGGEMSPLPQMTHWYNKNRSIFWILIHTKSRKWGNVQKRVGYFSVMPLTENARKLIEREELNGLKFTTEHMVKKDEQPAAIYIGGIAAKRLPFRSRAILLTYLKEHMRRARERGVSLVYSRPVNEDGLRILLKNGFAPVADLPGNELNRIYKAIIPPVDRSLSDGPDN